MLPAEQAVLTSHLGLARHFLEREATREFSGRACFPAPGSSPLRPMAASSFDCLLLVFGCFHPFLGERIMAKKKKAAAKKTAKKSAKKKK